MVIVRPVEQADIAVFAAGVPTPTIWGFSVLEDGKLIAIGGLAYLNGRATAFSEMLPEMKRYPVTLHKLALRVLNHARERGHRYVWAEPDEETPAARRWLERLGFEFLDEGKTIARWQGS